VFHGALRRIARRPVLDEVEVFEHALHGAVDSVRAEDGPLRDRWSAYTPPADVEAQQRHRADGARAPVAAHRTHEGMAVVRFDKGFTEGVATEIRDAISRLDRGATPLRGLVLDLRGNGGGWVSEAQDLLDALVHEGPLGIYRYGEADRPPDEYRATGEAPFGHLPLAVLIDGGTASMGEHVAGMLQSLAATRGVVVLGEPSYGKGIMQETYGLEHGELKISVARWYDAKGRNTQGAPVRPDIDTRRAIELQRAAHPGREVDDPVMRQAIAELERMAAARPSARR
jgi:C-terminal peptidase prc